ncbi:MAG: hypothetical protein STSR0006_07890 [Lentimicrobium sp.]
MKQKIFLLGGHDLEMLEIKRLLKKFPDILVFDKGLNWQNADISSYEDVLNEYGNKEEVEIYGIELHFKEASELPSNYHIIDHHNEYSEKPSSLEQVANLLHVNLSRKQQLIAANDKGYIPAMQKMGATTEEMEEIRFLDRQAQGVTSEDEQKAEASVREKIVEKDVIVVKALTHRFSPICDRLYPYKKLLIYTSDTLVFYGTGKKKVVEHYIEAIKNGKMFHGGGDEGFIGTVQGVYRNEELMSIKNKIINLVSQ